MAVTIRMLRVLHEVIARQRLLGSFKINQALAKQLKKRVRQAMETLNYHPNFNARSLASNKTKCHWCRSSKGYRCILSKLVLP